MFTLKEKKKIPKKNTTVSFFFCVKKCESLSCIIRDSLGANTHIAPCCYSLIAPAAHSEIPREILQPFCNSVFAWRDPKQTHTHTGTRHTLPDIRELSPWGVAERCHIYLLPQETRSRKSVTSIYSRHMVKYNCTNCTCLQRVSIYLLHNVSREVLLRYTTFKEKCFRS